MSFSKEGSRYFMLGQPAQISYFILINFIVLVCPIDRKCVFSLNGRSGVLRWQTGLYNPTLCTSTVSLLCEGACGF